DAVVEKPRIYIDGHEYSHDFVKVTSDGVYVSSTFLRDIAYMELFCDEQEGIVVFTSLERVVYIGLEDALPQDLIWKDAVAYIPLHTLELLYKGRVMWHSESRILHMERPLFRSKPWTLPQNNSLRCYPDKKATVRKKIQKDQHVFILRILGSWFNVRTNQGNVGWVEVNTLDTKDFVHHEFYPPPFVEEPEKNPAEKICMTWQYVYRTTPDPNELYVVEELNVIAPTWLYLKNSEGDLADKGRIDYVDWAHSHQYQVWIACTNSFDPSMTQEVLQSTRKRKKVIDRLCQIIVDYGAEGVNIDWENIYVKDKDFFTQFMRELYPIFKQKGLVVSVDITTISESENWSLCYDRPAIGKTTDFVVLMAYDQYWAGGDESGSVAEYEWVKQGVEELVELVPSQKVILGIPFYSRLWIEDESMQPKSVSSESYFMDYAMELAEIHAAQWDETIRQYVAQWRDRSHIYTLWVEDPRSIEHKVQLVHTHGLAGVAFWRKGYEIPEVWPRIGTQLQDVADSLEPNNKENET
ncbi:MAG: glycosyl hydrolase family 18 protein, partial [Caldisericia bacterium]|nr:glycosyl hydrolase family 18 protein [Caldisericia bacterium]